MLAEDRASKGMLLMLRKQVKYFLFMLICFWNTSLYAFFSLYVAPGMSYDSIQNSGNTITYQGLDPRIGVGFKGIGFSGLDIGAEVFAYPVKALTINNDATAEGSFRTKYSWGASLLPGFNLDYTILLFIRVGVIYTNFAVLDTTQTGLQLGAGIDAILYGPWSGRIEYTRTEYRRYQSLNGIHGDIGTFSLIYNFGYDPNQKGFLCF